MAKGSMQLLVADMFDWSGLRVGHTEAQTQILPDNYAVSCLVA